MEMSDTPSSLPENTKQPAQAPFDTDKKHSEGSTPAHPPEATGAAKREKPFPEPSSEWKAIPNEIGSTASSITDSAPTGSGDTVASEHSPMELIVSSTAEAVDLEAKALDGTQPGAFAPGTLFGHFIIVKFIGGGGMGRVYLANDTTLDRKVAIKVLPRQRANDQGIVARFMNEARSAARLNHEHIAQVYFAGDHNGIPYIAFEYVEGTNIRSLVEKYGLFSIPQAINFLIQIVHALVHAHAHGVVHRDVKPSNILITKEGRAKLIDMGLARLLHSSEDREDLTASGVTLGTFDYISPEQARDPRNADIRSDIYSLGCTLFFMLAGRPPFPEGTVLQKLLQHQGDLPPDIREFQPEIPAEVAHLLQKMMAKDPRQRFQTPAALIDALVVIAEMVGLKPTGPGRVIWIMRPPVKRSAFLVHVPWIVSATVLLLCIFILNFIWNKDIDFQSPDIVPFLPQFNATASGIKTTPAESSIGPGAPHAGGPLLPDMTGTISNPAVAVQVAGFEPFSPESGIMRFPILRRFFSPEDLTEELVSRLGPMASGYVVTLRPIDFEIEGNASKAGKDAFISRAVTPWTTRQQVDDADGTVQGTPAKPALLTVDPTGEIPGAYRSLGAALAVAGKNATIELASNVPIQATPLTFAERQLNIVAAEGMTPTLLFAGTETGWPYSDRSMLTLSACTLNFQGISLELIVPQDIAAPRWTLFEILDSVNLRFAQCRLTIRNASGDAATYHQEVAFFRSVASPLGLDSSATGSSGITLELNDSLLRGEASILQAEFDRNVDMLLTNVAVASTKPVVSVEDPKTAGESASWIRLTLRHVTAYLRSPLIRQIRTQSGTTPLLVEAALADSILIMNQSPLVFFRGIGIMDTAERNTLSWKEEGRNFYQDLPPAVWRLRPLTPNALTYNMSLEDWNRSWKTELLLDAAVLDRLPMLASKPVSRIFPAELQVRQDADNPAYRVASGANASAERLDAGILFGEEKIPKWMNEE